MSRRSKSNLIPPEPVWTEPKTGPRSATCFCRVMDRRQKRREATPGLYSEDLPEYRPTIIQVRDEADIEEISEALRELHGLGKAVEVLLVVS